jgi:hypothetical protein
MLSCQQASWVLVEKIHFFLMCEFLIAQYMFLWSDVQKTHLLIFVYRNLDASHGFLLALGKGQWDLTASRKAAEYYMCV